MRYRNFNTDEIVEEDECLDYVLKKCGIELKYVKDSMEQIEFKAMLVDWYFSGNWIKEKDEEISNIEKDYEIADMIYQDNLDIRLGLV